MKKFVIKISLFFLLMICLDFIVGAFLKKIYFSQKSKLIYAINDCKEEVLVFGASRAQHQIIPSILEDSLRMSCYNFGTGGQNIYYHYTLLKSIVNRYVPKIVILEISYIDCIKTSSTWDKDKLTVFYPVYTLNDEIKTSVDLIGFQERFKMLSNCYRFNSLAYNMIYKYKNKNNDIDFILNGFIPLSGHWRKPIQAEDEYECRTQIYDINKLSYLEKFVLLCQKHNIHLIVTAAPIYMNKRCTSSVEIARKMVENAGFRFLNLEQDSSFTNHINFFNDPLHLNTEGASLYSVKILEKIKSVIQK
jgi:hypothetical protein